MSEDDAFDQCAPAGARRGNSRRHLVGRRARRRAGRRAPPRARRQARGDHGLRHRRALRQHAAHVRARPADLNLSATSVDPTPPFRSALVVSRLWAWQTPSIARAPSRRSLGSPSSCRQLRAFNWGLVGLFGLQPGGGNLRRHVGPHAHHLRARRARRHLPRRSGRSPARDESIEIRVTSCE